MPLDECADFTTKNTRPVICQRCHASFENGTELFFMQDRKGDGPGKHICAGCRQHYLRKTESTRRTIGQLSYIIYHSSRLSPYQLQVTSISRLLRNIRLLRNAAHKRQLQRLRDRVWVTTAITLTRHESAEMTAGFSHPLWISAHVHSAPATGTAEPTHRSLPWPKRTDVAQSGKHVNQNLPVLRGGFQPIVLPKYVSNRETQSDYGYQEAHKFARKALSTHQNEVVVIKVTMMSLKPGYKNPQIVSVRSILKM